MVDSRPRFQAIFGCLNRSRWRSILLRGPCCTLEIVDFRIRSPRVVTINYQTTAMFLRVYNMYTLNACWPNSTSIFDVRYCTRYITTGYTDSRTTRRDWRSWSGGRSFDLRLNAKHAALVFCTF